MTHKLLTILALGIVASACERDSGMVEPEFRQYSIRDFLKTTAMGGGFFDTQESSLLVHSNASGVYNVYSVDILTGEQKQLTNFKETTYSVAYLPGSPRFLFMQDSGGDEKYKLYLSNPDGNAQKLTVGTDTRELFHGFSFDRTSFYTSNNSRNRKYMDVYRWDVNKLTPTLVYLNDEGMTFGAISPDGRWLAMYKSNDRLDSDLYVFDLGGDRQRRVLGRDGGTPVRIVPKAFAADGHKLLYTTDESSEFAKLASYDLESGESANVAEYGWDVSDVDISRSGRFRIVAVNENSVMRLEISDTKTGDGVDIPELRGREIRSAEFSDSERYLKFFAMDDRNPGDLYLFDMQTRKLTQLTHNLNADISMADLVDARLVRLSARDGLKFSGYLYRPREASITNKVPALLWIHGGPGGQSRPLYSASKQFLINHGYAIFDLNYRGSSGFGRSFGLADDQKHGREPLWDCVDAKDWLADNIDWIDSERIGILGGSYGGYMVMAALAFAPDEFDVGVDLFGVTNWVRTLKNMPPWWEDIRAGLFRELGDPSAQEDMLREISPLFHASNVRKPVIILQGANDPRVLQVESDEMVDNIRSAGGTVEYVLFEDEGHGFTKNDNRIRGWNAILSFLDTHLKSM